MYKSMNEIAPKYLQCLFTQRRTGYNLRNLEGNLSMCNYLRLSFDLVEPADGIICLKT